MTLFLGIDQSTSATKALLFNQDGELLDQIASRLSGPGKTVAPLRLGRERANVRTSEPRTCTVVRHSPPPFNLSEATQPST